MSMTNEDTPENVEVPTPAPAKPKRVRKPAAKKPGIVAKIAKALTGGGKSKPAAKKAGKKAPAKKAGKKAPAKKTAKPTKKAPAKKAAGKKAVKATRGARGKGPVNIKGKLYKLLLAKMPKRFMSDPDTLDFAVISEVQGMTTEGIYKWFRSDKIPPERALVFIKASAGKLKTADMIDFVFKA